MKGELYLVGTPIGNLGDISPRGIRTLKEVDFIVVEDTRVSLKLLNKFDIKKRLISYRQQNSKEAGEKIINQLKENKRVALITDAGMPGISDPGRDIVKLARANDIKISVIPGPSAVVSALSVSGFSDNFLFLGFLPPKSIDRIESLAKIKNMTYTLIIYEAPHRLKDTLKDLNEVLKNRNIIIAKELTKTHEKIIETKIQDAIEYYDKIIPKGEYVIVIEQNKCSAEDDGLKDAIDFAIELIGKGVKLTKAAKIAASMGEYDKKEIYRKLLDLKNDVKQKTKS